MHACTTIRAAGFTSRRRTCDPPFIPKHCTAQDHATPRTARDSTHASASPLHASCTRTRVCRQRETFASRRGCLWCGSRSSPVSHSGRVAETMALAEEACASGTLRHRWIRCTSTEPARHTHRATVGTVGGPFRTEAHARDGRRAAAFFPALHVSAPEATYAVGLEPFARGIHSHVRDATLARRGPTTSHGFRGRSTDDLPFAVRFQRERNGFEREIEPVEGSGGSSPSRPEASGEKTGSPRLPRRSIVPSRRLEGKIWFRSWPFARGMTRKQSVRIVPIDAEDVHSSAAFVPPPEAISSGLSIDAWFPRHLPPSSSDRVVRWSPTHLVSRPCDAGGDVPARFHPSALGPPSFDPPSILPTKDTSGSIVSFATGRGGPDCPSGRPDRPRYVWQ